MKMPRIKKYLSLLCMVCLISITATAQPSQGKKQEPASYSAETLVKFIEATKHVSRIQQEGEQKMVQMIEEEDLDVETFNKIAEMMMSPEQVQDDNISAEQMESFNSVLEKLQVFQVEMQREMESAITGTGMEVEEYQNIIEDYQSDPALQQQIQEMLQE